MEGCQLSLAPPSQIDAEHVHVQSSSNDVQTAKNPLPFDLNLVPGEVEEEQVSWSEARARPATSFQMWLPESTPNLPAPPSDIAVDHNDSDDDTVTIVEGGSASSGKRKRSMWSTRPFKGEKALIIESESENETILDDGFRWHKYGHKTIMGNLFPRAYYKCISDGCSVRKHVERDSRNMKIVKTTYEGKHNHECPSPKKQKQPAVEEALAVSNTQLLSPNNHFGSFNIGSSSAYTLQMMHYYYYCYNYYYSLISNVMAYHSYGVQPGGASASAFPTAPLFNNAASSSGGSTLAFPFKETGPEA